MSDTRQLDTGQLAKFTTPESSSNKILNRLRPLLADRFPDGAFGFLDIGGGNGNWTDFVLRNYPRSSGVIVDNSAEQLALNTPDDRKTTVHGSAADLERLLGSRQFDVLFCHFLLHHLVTGTYAGSLGVMAAALASFERLVAPGGRLSLIEIIPSAYWIDTLPSRAIFSVTSSRLLAPLAKRLGANSAGVGVCYVTSSQISSLLATAGLEVESMADFDDYAHPLPVRLGLHARRIRPVLHWVRRREP